MNDVKDLIARLRVGNGVGGYVRQGLDAADALETQQDRIRVLEAELEAVWDNGYEAAARFYEGKRGHWETPKRRPDVRQWVDEPKPPNPYRVKPEDESRKRFLLTHPHDGHGPDDTCIDCAKPEDER